MLKRCEVDFKETIDYVKRRLGPLVEIENITADYVTFKNDNAFRLDIFDVQTIHDEGLLLVQCDADRALFRIDCKGDDLS